MARPLLYLHVGNQKTGSTSIQRVLDAHREELAETGFLYPRNSWALGRDDYQHSKWSRAFVRGRATVAERYIAGLARMVQPDQRVILSTENLSRGRVPADGTLLGERREYLTRVRAALEPFDVHVIVLLRSQDSFADSLYRELSVKRGGANRLADFDKWVERSTERFDYEPAIELYREFFDDVTVLNFDKSLSQGGPVKAFFDAVGMPLPDGALDVRTRPSADARIVLWLRDQRQRKRTMQQAFSWSAAAMGVFPDPGVPTLWSSEEARARFLERFTGEYGGDYFGPPRPYTYRAVLTDEDRAKIAAAFTTWRREEWESPRRAAVGAPGTDS
jgi:hypothetical protein